MHVMGNLHAREGQNRSENVIIPKKKRTRVDTVNQDTYQKVATASRPGHGDIGGRDVGIY